MKFVRVEFLLRRAALLIVLAFSCASAWAAATICAYPESGSGIGGTGISGSGIGGTGKIARGTGMGGTGITPGADDRMRPAGSVIATRGTVVAQSNGRSRALAKGDPVCVGETITTSQSAVAEIRMADDGLIEIRPKTQLTIEQYAFNGTDKDGSLLSVLKGACRIITGKIGKRYPENDLIKTPVVLIGIRGTDHEVAVVLPGDRSAYPSGTYDKVNHGVTFIRSDRGEVEIHPGQVGFAASAGDLPAILEAMPAFFLSGPSGASESALSGEGKHTEPPREAPAVAPDSQLPAEPDIPDIPDALEIPELPEIPDILDLPEVPEAPEEPE